LIFSGFRSALALFRSGTIPNDDRTSRQNQPNVSHQERRRSRQIHDRKVEDDRKSATPGSNKGRADIAQEEKITHD
jgi:hypothetical protein